MADDIQFAQLPTEADPHVIIGLQKAGYDLFRARNDEEISLALLSILGASPYVTAYYEVENYQMRLVGMAGKPLQSGTGAAPKTIAITPSDIAAKYSGGVIRFEFDGNPVLPGELEQALKASGCSSGAYLPVVESVETIGLFVFGFSEKAPFLQEYLDPFVNLADLLPIAREKVKTDRAIQLRLREMESIATIGQAIAAVTDLNNLYRTIHQQITETIGDVFFIVALYDARTNTIQIPYRFEDGKVDTIESFPLGEGLTSILLRDRQPLMIVEDTERRAAALGAKVVGKAAKSWLGCPLIMANEAIGAIIVQDAEREHRFNEDHLRFLMSLSAQVAGAIFNARLLDEARQRALQLQTAADISRDVSGSLIVDELLEKSVNLIRDQFNYYHAAIFLVDKSGDYASIREASGDIGAKMKATGHKLKVGSNSIVGYVTSKGQSLIVNDTNQSPIHLPNPLLPETRAEAGIPIKVSDRIIGMLDIQSRHPFAFSDETVKILQIVADQIAVAFVNSELFADAQERLSQHRLLHHVTTAAASSTTIEEALTSAVQGLQVTLGGDQISILLADRENKMLEVKSAMGYPDGEVYSVKIPFNTGVTGWVATHRQPLRINDVTKDARYISINNRIRSEMAIPLIYRNEVLGVLNVESMQPDAYSENDEEMLGTLGGSLAAIIAHSRLLEQFRQQVEFDQMLFEITAKFRRTNNINTILETTVNEINKTFGARHAAIKIDLENLSRKM
jgi:GAF domain-containing protein